MAIIESPDYLGFYKLSTDDYTNRLNYECDSGEALPEISYRYQTEQKTQTIAEKIFSCLYAIVTYPYRLLQWLAGKLIVPASWTYSQLILDMRNKRQPIPDALWKYKRISIDVGGMTIDAMLIVRDSTAENGKWILSSDGNGSVYELHKTFLTDTKQLALCLNANALVFNYPGVGASQGTPLPETIAKTYKAMLRFLEDKDAGIGAETIIGYGHSLGGAAQALGLDSHELDPDINYVFIKDRTFSTLSKAATDMLGSWAGKLAQFLGWDMDTAAGSKKLKAHEIILQSTKHVYGGYTVINDGTITREASLLERFIKENTLSKENRSIVHLLNKRHNDPLNQDELLHITITIERSVKKQISDRAAALASQEQAS
jgi:hypothetical protein